MVRARRNPHRRVRVNDVIDGGTTFSSRWAEASRGCRRPRLSPEHSWKTLGLFPSPITQAAGCQVDHSGAGRLIDCERVRPAADRVRTTIIPLRVYTGGRGGGEKCVFGSACESLRGAPPHLTGSIHCSLSMYFTFVFVFIITVSHTLIHRVGCEW